MAQLSVIINAVDNISKKLSSIGSQADNVADSFQTIEQEGDSALNSVQSDADKLEQAMQSMAEGMADGFVDSFYEMADAAGLSADETRQAWEELPDFFRNLADGLEESFDGAAEGSEEAGEEVEKLGHKLKDTGDKGKESGDKMTDAMGSLESFLAAAGIVKGLNAIADAFIACAEQAELTETAFAKLETIAGSGSMSSLTSQIMELSSSTGIAATDLADVAYNAISAGTAVEDSVSMAATASKLATAGFTDTSSALGVLTTALNSYGDSAGTATEIADSLITVQNLGVTTVAELSANMGKAIATASAYNVGLDNLEASYISVTKAGINTAEGTTYISAMLNELGKASSDVANVLKEETGQSFGQLMEEGYSLADVLGILSNSVNGDAEALMNLWGSAEAGKAASAIVGQGLEQFNDNLVKLGESAGSTEKAYATMADTTEFAHNRMKTSFENMRVSVGNALNPLMENLYNIGAGFANVIGSVADKAPWLVGLVTGLASGLGTLALAVTGVVVVTKLWTAAQAALAAATATATAAMAVQVALVAAIAIGVGVMIASWTSAMETEEEMTASTAAMQDQLAETTTQYERACAVMGENSEAAITLKADMEYLADEIANSGQTLQEFYDDLNSVCDAHDKVAESFRGVQEEISTNKIVSEDLISRLRDLSKNTDDATSSQGEMEAIVKRLNQMYPQLGISIDDVNNNLDGLAEKIEAVGNATKQQEYEAAQSTYTDLLTEQNELLEKQAEAEANLNRAREKYNNQNLFSGTWNELMGSGASEAMDDAQAAYNRVNEAIKENQELLEETGEIINSYTDIVNGNSDEMVSAYDAVNIAIAQNQEAVEELAKEYQQAYDAALSSIQGQWSLWETADEVTEASIEDMKAAMQSQMQYWQEYADNLENLHGRNIAGLDEMVASMDDGSVESAAYLEAMANASDTELTQMVRSFESLQEAQKNTADDMATLETDFEDRLSEIESAFKETVANMNMETEARTAAEATLRGYISGIKSMQVAAETAAGDVASSVANKLSASDSGSSVEHHAGGTLDSGSAYIAGDSPFGGNNYGELILSGGHDTVFPASETNRIIQAVNNYNNNSITNENRSAEGYVLAGSAGSASGVSSSKTITLDIKGSGSMSIEKGMDRESVWANIRPNIKNAVMDILTEEIFEGSDFAYGY